MIKAFQIFKEGKTSEWITILIPSEIFTEEKLQSKINFYLELGYSVRTIK